MKARPLIIGLLTFGLCVQCQSPNPQQIIYDSTEALISQALQQIEILSINELKKLMDDEEPFVLIDVRELKEHQSGYIPGSENISRGLLEFRILK